MTSRTKIKPSFLIMLYVGFIDAFVAAQRLLRQAAAGLRWSWRFAVHLAKYGGEPGDIIFQDEPGQEAEYARLIRRGAQRHLAVFESTSASSSPSMFFVLSNRHFNDRIQPDTAETETIARLLEKAQPGRTLARLMWSGRLYTPYELSPISLKRYPDDVSLPAERRWMGKA